MHDFLPGLDLCQMENSDAIKAYIKDTLEETKHNLYIEKTGLQLYLDTTKSCYDLLCQLLQSTFQPRLKSTSVEKENDPEDPDDSESGSVIDEEGPSSEATGPSTDETSFIWSQLEGHNKEKQQTDESDSGSVASLFEDLDRTFEALQENDPLTSEGHGDNANSAKKPTTSQDGGGNGHKSSSSCNQPNKASSHNIQSVVKGELFVVQFKFPSSS